MSPRRAPSARKRRATAEPSAPKAPVTTTVRTAVNAQDSIAIMVLNVSVRLTQGKLPLLRVTLGERLVERRREQLRHGRRKCGRDHEGQQHGVLHGHFHHDHE